jgi:iron complex outermembrane receptor protein
MAREVGRCRLDRRVYGFALALAACAASAPGYGEEPADEFFDLSLGELLTLEITSVSRKAEPISHAAAAVFVITRDDLRRSGVTTIPEALRMVPGVQVARIDANKWAITARGFNGRFANKLLVLMDGRSVYTPLFAGVYWDVQDTLLEDIERIEVIRGPGATLWGSNAVNGVINIITRSAADTQGLLLSAGAGDEERGFAGGRYGGALGEHGHYRVYAKAFERDASVDADSGRDNGDDWGAARTGFRMDLVPGERDTLTVQGDYYQGRSGETVEVSSLEPPYLHTADRDQDLSGFDVLAHWQRALSGTDDLGLQVYYDHTDRDWALLGEERDTVDLELQYRTQRFEGHDLILGLGYRRTSDDLSPSFSASTDREERSDELFSAFVQDDIELSPERFTLTVGTKLEHNDYTGFEYQPNLRMLWTPDRRRTWWASVARAVRTPSRADHDANLALVVAPPGAPGNPTPVPQVVRIIADEDTDSEVLMAYEAGFKWQAGRGLNVDLAVFYNDYDALRSSHIGNPVCEPAGTPPGCFFAAPPPTNLLIPVALGDRASGTSHGLELAADWRPHPKWRLQAAYSYLEMDLEADTGFFAADSEDIAPSHQLSLRSWLNPRADTDLDLWLRYVDELDGFGTQSIDAYWELDARAAWRPRKGLELAVVGQNLLEDRHAEFVSELGDVPLSEVERSVYVQVRLGL